MTLRHLLDKLSQLMNGPPPYTCGACGGTVTRQGEEFVRACGHEGEVVAHVKAKVSGLGKSRAAARSR